MTNDPMITIQFDEVKRVRSPGETLSGSYWIEHLGERLPSAIEFSVLWKAEGGGNEDIGVYQFERISAEDAGFSTSEPWRFLTRLPFSPRSYEGELVRITWCIRVRAFFRGGQEIVGERTFRLI